MNRFVFTFAAISLASITAQVPRDSDQDGIPDSWEIANGFNRLDRSDFANLLQYLLATNPSASLSDGAINLRFRERFPVPGTERRVEKTSSLSAPANWTTEGIAISQSTLVAPGINEISLRAQFDGAAQFYRVQYNHSPGPIANVLLHTAFDDGAEAGQLGNAAPFTNSTQLITYPTAVGPAQNLRLDRGEIELLYRPNYDAGSNDDTPHALVTVGDVFNAPNIRLYESDRLTFLVTTPLWETIAASAPYHAALWRAGDWVRIRATWDTANPTNSLQLFVNEIRVGGGTNAGGWSAGDYNQLQTIYVGAANASGDYTADGLVDDFFIRDNSTGIGVIGGGEEPGGGGGGPGENRAPIIETPRTQIVSPNSQVRFTIAASDPDGNLIRFTLSPGAPTGVALSATGELTWTPQANTTGQSFRIGFEVTDNTLTSTGSVTIVVVNPTAAGVFDPTAIFQLANIPLQPVGVPFVDPVFGTTLRRVSNTSESGGYETQIYNQLQAFSTDDQYILLASSENYIIRRMSDFSRVQNLDSSPWNCPRWHPRRPHTIVHYDSNEDTTVRVQFTDVETLVTQTVFTFPAQYERILGNQSFDELSHDGRWMAGFLTRNDGMRVIFTLDLENARLGVVKPLDQIYAGECAPDPVFGMMEPDWVGVSPLGRYLVVQWQRSALTPCSGLCTYTIDTGEFRGRLQDSTRHGDLGLDFDGNTEVFMTTELFSPWDQNRPSSIYRRLPGLPTVAENVFLQPLDWSSEDHYSMQGPNGVGLVSWGRTGDVNDYPFDGELFIQNTDGSVRRLVHHRSTQCGYWVQIRATMSRSGRYVIFASDWGRPQDCPDANNPGGVGAGDPYIIDLSIPRP